MVDEQHSFPTHLVEFGKPVIVGIEGAYPVFVHDVIGDGLEVASFGRAVGIRIVGPIAGSIGNELGLESVCMLAAALSLL